MRLLMLSLFALPLLSVACDQPIAGSGSADGNTPAISDKVGSKANAPLILDHDFGIVPHGEQRMHELELDMSLLNEPHVPLRVHLECSCGKAEILLRKPDGSERGIDGSGYARNLPADDEKVFLRITLDTRKKEAVDLPTTVSRGYVLLQPVDDDTGMARQRWAFVVRFGIDAPVLLRPFAALDFGSVAESMTAETLTTLRGDENHLDMRFLAVKTTDQSITAKLEPDGDSDGNQVVLRAECTPGQRGNHRCLVLVQTSLKDYTVALEVSWKVVPDLEATPLDKISITAPLDQEQPESAMARQAVLVIDHNRHRSPEFVVRSIVGGDGREVTSMFATRLTAVPTKDRQQRLEIRYLGGLLPNGPELPDPNYTFRGQILLAKPGAQPSDTNTTLPIDLVVFPSRTP